jgi:hypothetical protein
VAICPCGQREFWHVGLHGENAQTHTERAEPLSLPDTQRLTKAVKCSHRPSPCSP